MLLASTGDLPDVIPILTSSNIIPLAKQGFLADMNELLDKYASPLLKYVVYDEVMTTTNNKAYADSMYNGKLYALPQGLDLECANTDTLIFRKDLLDKLGMDVPSSIAEMDKVFAAYKASNPSKYCLYLRNWCMELPQFWQAFGVSTMPTDIYKVDGKYVFGCTQPGAKEGLAKLREWYQKGYISPTFTTEEDRTTATISGKYLATYNGDWGSMYMYQTAAKSNPSAQFVPMDYLEGSTGPNFIPIGTPWPSCVSAKSKYKEAIMMEASAVAESYLRNDDDLRAKFGNSYPKTEPQQVTNVSEVASKGTKYAKYNYAENEIGPGFFNTASTSVGLLNNVGRITRGKDAAAAYDIFVKNGKNFTKAYQQFNNVQKYIAMTDGNMSYAQTYSVKTLESTLLAEKIMNSAFTAGKLKFREVNTEDLDSYAKYSDALNTLTINTYTAIIKGTKSLDDFDAYVKEFNAKGGQAILDEVNKKYK